MIRAYIKCWNQNFLRVTLQQQNDVLKWRYHLVPHRTISQCKFSPILLQLHFGVQSFRQKSRSSKNKQESESSSESYDEFDDTVQDKHTKVMNINVTSLRVDGILKNALGMSRNKVETLFYESKIRVNGEKILKKSVAVQTGDEIDLLKGPDLKNPNFINVARVEILSVKPDEDSIAVKLKRNKSLTIEPYEGH